MSLKAFHILFVLIATLGALGFGYWALQDYKKSGEFVSAAIGGFSIFCAAAMIVYGVWFLKKLKGVSWL